METYSLRVEAVADMLEGHVSGSQIRRWLTEGQEPSVPIAIRTQLLLGVVPGLKDVRDRLKSMGPQIGEAHALQDDLNELLKSVEDGEPLTPQESAICLPIIRALLQILRSEAPGRAVHVANQLAFLIDNKKAATDHPQIAEALHAIERFKRTPPPSSARPRPAAANKRRRRQ